MRCNPEQMNDASPDRPTWRLKTIAYVGVWLVALFATNPSGSLWALAWMFPLGLFALIPPAWQEAGRVWLAAGFALYLIHAFFYFRAREKRSAYLWFVILVLALLGNVAGCRSMNNPH
jgi:putative effector of murein hydrolase LrgA (UPF0299 family)